MKVRVAPFTVEVDPARWREHFEDADATPADIRAEIQAAAEQWLQNYLDDIGVKP